MVAKPVLLGIVDDDLGFGEVLEEEYRLFGSYVIEILNMRPTDSSCERSTQFRLIDRFSCGFRLCRLDFKLPAPIIEFLSRYRSALEDLGKSLEGLPGLPDSGLEISREARTV